MTTADWRIYKSPCFVPLGAFLYPGYTESPDGGRRPAPSPLPWSDRLGSGPYPGAARARPEPFRARGLLPPLVGALRLQTLRPSPEAAPLGGRARPSGPRRERGSPRPRRRHRGRVQGRVAQPPVRGRAVPGRGDGDRRDPARRDRDGGAADRAPRRALVRRARLSLPAGSRRDRPLRQLRRRADGRRPDRLRPGLRLQLPRQRDVRGAARERPVALGEGERAGAQSSSSTAPRPDATASAAPRYSRAPS